MAVAVGGMIAIKIIQSQFQLTTRFQPPGATRGDLELRDDCLPEEIAGWKKRSFLPPAQNIPEGQYWWSHSWSYSNSIGNALVVFDQADFSGWHELTYCYQGSGWELIDREIVTADDNENSWPYIRARFKRNQSESAALVFSLFYDNGTIVQPVDFSEVQLFGTDLATRIANRQRNLGKRMALQDQQRKSLQSQVFMVSQNAVSNETMDELTELHLASRTCFREAWNERPPFSSERITD